MRRKIKISAQWGKTTVIGRFKVRQGKKYRQFSVFVT